VEGALHLKSVMSAFDRETILFGDCRAARKIARELEDLLPSKHEFVFVPDPVASNVLSLGRHVVIQDGFPGSEAVLSELAAQRGRTLIKVAMSEFIKADGALTCCSLLF
jgi:dimethylargininase